MKGQQEFIDSHGLEKANEWLNYMETESESLEKSVVGEVSET